MKNLKYIISIIAVHCLISFTALANEYILPSGSEPRLVSPEISVDGLNYFILDQDKKELALMGNEPIWLYPHTYTRYVGYMIRDQFTGNSYSGNLVVPSTVEHNGEIWNVTYISYGAFMKCPDLLSIELPETIRTIGEDSFWSCTSLKEIKLGNSVELVSLTAFEGCSSLESADFGGAAYIDASALNYCTSLKEIRIKPEQCISIETIRHCPCIERVYCTTTSPYKPDWPLSTSFATSEQYENIEIIVPEGCEEEYAQTKPWSDFKKIIGQDLSSIKAIEPDLSDFSIDRNTITAKGFKTDVFSTSGILIRSILPGESANLSKGIYIVRSNNKVSKFLVK